ncbi:hypothetical protein BDZ89DRAFT_340413 [Hymenopellis radicata]|nr:hypothetical protein BDZ89DRAFT_340413 [Hymenopellis radicata]
MDFRTAQLQRRALLLEDRTLFGFALGVDGVFIYASFWSDDDIHISADPVCSFPFDGNTPLQIVRLFLFLRRLAKNMTAQLAEDRRAVALKARAIASGLEAGSTVWRVSKPGPSGPSHSNPSSRRGSDAAPPSKRQKSAHTGNASVLHTNVQGGQANTQTLTKSGDTLTAQNLSGFMEYERDIERWVAHVDIECAMGGEPSCMMANLDQEEPCMDGEASVPALKDAEATVEMLPENHLHVV